VLPDGLSQMGHTVLGNADQATEGGTDKRPECWVTVRGLGDATPEYLDRWTATQAAPKAPQRKRSCRRSLNLRVREPDRGS